MHMVSIGIADDKRKVVAEKLNILLADEYVLFTKLFKYHWNVRGMSFGSLHALFQEQYEELFLTIDAVAERIRALGHMADGTLREFSQKTTLEEKPGENPEASSMIAQLVADYEAIIRNVRADVDETAQIGDMGTSDFLNDLLEKHEKAAWILRAHIANV